MIKALKVSIGIVVLAIFYMTHTYAYKYGFHVGASVNTFEVGYELGKHAAQAESERYH